MEFELFSIDIWCAMLSFSLKSGNDTFFFFVIYIRISDAVLLRQVNKKKYFSICSYYYLCT